MNHIKFLLLNCLLYSMNLNGAAADQQQSTVPTLAHQPTANAKVISSNQPQDSGHSDNLHKKLKLPQKPPQRLSSAELPQQPLSEDYHQPLKQQQKWRPSQQPVHRQQQPQEQQLTQQPILPQPQPTIEPQQQSNLQFLQQQIRQHDRRQIPKEATPQVKLTRTQMQSNLPSMSPVLMADAKVISTDDSQDFVVYEGYDDPHPILSSHNDKNPTEDLNSILNNLNDSTNREDLTQEEEQEVVKVIEDAVDYSPEKIQSSVNDSVSMTVAPPQHDTIILPRFSAIFQEGTKKDPGVIAKEKSIDGSEDASKEQLTKETEEVSRNDTETKIVNKSSEASIDEVKIPETKFEPDSKEKETRFELDSERTLEPVLKEDSSANAAEFETTTNAIIEDDVTTSMATPETTTAGIEDDLTTAMTIPETTTNGGIEVDVTTAMTTPESNIKEGTGYGMTASTISPDPIISESTESIMTAATVTDKKPEEPKVEKTEERVIKDNIQSQELKKEQAVRDSPDLAEKLEILTIEQQQTIETPDLNEVIAIESMADTFITTNMIYLFTILLVIVTSLIFYKFLPSKVHSSPPETLDTSEIEKKLLAKSKQELGLKLDADLKSELDRLRMMKEKIELQNSHKKQNKELKDARENFTQARLSRNLLISKIQTRKSAKHRLEELNRLLLMARNEKFRSIKNYCNGQDLLNSMRVIETQNMARKSENEIFEAKVEMEFFKEHEETLHKLAQSFVDEYDQLNQAIEAEKKSDAEALNRNLKKNLALLESVNIWNRKIDEKMREAYKYYKLYIFDYHKVKSLMKE